MKHAKPSQLVMQLSPHAYKFNKEEPTGETTAVKWPVYLVLLFAVAALAPSMC